MIPPRDVADLKADFRTNPQDVGVGLYNPSTGEIRLGSFDRVTQQQGHQGLADALGITKNSDWRGFLVSTDGKFHPMSHFNLLDGSLMLKPSHEIDVRKELQQAGLLS